MVVGAFVAPLAFSQMEFKNYFSHYELLKYADGKPIEIDGGYCKPVFFDFNGDGKDDLLTGEFGTIRCESPIKDFKKGFVEGRGRVFINEADKGWSFSKFDWLMDRDTKKALYVPITCCTLLSPYLVDLNGDGFLDLISGSYVGELHIWYGDKNREFGSQTIVKDVDEKVINIGNASSVTTFGKNNNLLINSLYAGMYIVENIGTLEKPIYSSSPKRFTDEESLSSAQIYDWDEDGEDDLLYADGDGNLFLCKGENGKFLQPDHLIKMGKRVESTADLCPVVSGKNIRFTIYDYDKDGKMDIVMGATTVLTRKRTLTEDQKAISKKLNEERSIVIDKWGDLQDKLTKKYKLEQFFIGRVPYDKLSKKEAAEFKILDDECIRLGNACSPYRTSYLDPTSFLWVYYRK